LAVQRPETTMASRRATQFGPDKPEAAKKPYRAPSVRMLDANAAKATLETKALSGDVGARAMLNSISNSKTKRGSKSTESKLHSLGKSIR
jgi:hypothetical protein